MRVTAPAKLNLSLHITGKRADGYHELESLVAFTDLADTLRAEIADTLTLQAEGEFAEAAGKNDDNLVLRAARALQRATGCKKGARLHLEKNIPAGAGLGGGSSDAAATLLLLRELWQVEADLPKIAETLGADVPLFLDPSQPRVMRGIGDMLVSYKGPLPAKHAVLIYPNKPLATEAVYKAYRATGNTGERNDLQHTAMTLLPEVGEVLLALETALPQPLFARMSGSGSACFGLYREDDEAMAAAASLAAQYPNWWVKKVRLVSDQ